jgi:hypothetical protein
MNLSRWLPRRALPVVAALIVAAATAVIPAGPASAVVNVSCGMFLSPLTGNAASVGTTAFVNCTGNASSINVSIFLYRGGTLVASNGGGGSNTFGASAGVGVPCVPGNYQVTASASVLYPFGNIPASDFLSQTGPLIYFNCTNPPPTVNNPGTQRTLTGNAVSLQMTASGGTTPYTWSATGMPSGLSINPSTGLITGRSTAPVWYQVTVTATSSGGGSSGSTSFQWIFRNDGCAHC